MRLFLGMILGVFLTIFGALLHDTWAVNPSAGDTPPEVTEQRPMVNWDVVSVNWRRLQQHLREAWTTLSHKINS